MSTDQPGLRKRMQLEARRIFHQHEQLDTFFAVTMGALGQADEGAAREAFLHFQDALEAHFEVEERTHFPALHGLAPATDEQLAALVREHVEFREILAGLARAVEAGKLDETGRGLKELGDKLAAHEQLEERLLAGATRRPG
jgi:hemerythrin-like domain-containing protein